MMSRKRMCSLVALVLGGMVSGAAFGGTLVAGLILYRRSRRHA